MSQSFVAQKLASIDRRFLPPKLFYFAVAGAITAVGPFFGVFYQQLGIPSPQIGVLTGLPSLITLFAAPLWTGLADYTHRHKRILLITMACSVVGLGLVLQGAVFWALLPVICLYSFFMAPTQALVDNAVLRMLGSRRKNEFGRQRILGSFAAGIVGPLVSALVGLTGIRTAFYFALAFLGLGTGVSTRIEMDLPDETPAAPGEAVSYWVGLKTLLRDRRLAFFLLIVLMGMTARSSSMTYLYMHMTALGAPKAILGLAMTLVMIGEAPFFFYSDRLIKRWGTRGLIIASLLCSMTMLYTFAWMRSPWLGIAVHLLHGISYSGMWMAGVSYASHLAPPGLGATAQGLFNAVFMGLSFFGGSFLGGLMYDRYGGGRMFFWAAILATTALVLFVLNSRN